MEFKEFSTLHQSRLSNENVYGLCTSTIAMAQSEQIELDAVSQAVLTKFASANQELTAVIKKTNGSLLTAKITESDNARDLQHNGIKRTITFFSKDDDATVKEAALALKQFYAPYWDCNNKPLDTQTAIMSEMFGKYKASDDLKAHAALVGVESRFEKLKQLNTEFDTLYKSRTTETAASDSPSASSLRPAVEMLYSKFCQSVEMAYNFAPNNSITQLFGELENLRGKYNTLIN